MTDLPPPPPPPGSPPPPPSSPPPPPPGDSGGGFGAPPTPPVPGPPIAPINPNPYGTAPPADRVRMAWQRRYETDYVFSFWTAFGWSVLTCGLYWFYVFYQLIRRDRDHNARRLELLDGATAFAWEQCQLRRLDEELRPSFERIGAQMTVLRQLTTEFREPVIWLVLDILVSGIASIVGYVLIDGDLVRHDYAEGAIEAELSSIYARLGVTIEPPNPARLKNRHNYVARVIVSILTCGVYVLWWVHDLMVEGNAHFEHNWKWEDELAGGIQTLLTTSAA